ncbi:MAG: M48 family metalloprotease [Desulfuromonadaceae bacterium]|nr:M48 family metalloprotease [Desulfuromonadaceae bacterium]
MKPLILIISFVFLCINQSNYLYAADNIGHEWRTRLSVTDRDTFSETDLDEEITFGREVSARLLGQFKMSANKKLQKYVNLVGSTLAWNCSRPELVFHFVVIESSEINAYSTPGGYVFITTSVLAKMDNEAELAGVLAHEIAHITERHIVKELSLRGAEQTGLASISALIGGASKTASIAFSQAVDKAVDLLLRDGYKKEDEIQADATAVLLCALSGYDTSGLITFLDKISKVKSGVGKTYPKYDLRLATLQRAVSEQGIAGVKLAVNSERFAATLKKAEQGSSPIDMIRNVIPGGTP